MSDIEVEAYLELINEIDWSDAGAVEFFFSELSADSGGSLLKAFAESVKADDACFKRLAIRQEEIVALRERLRSEIYNKSLAISFIRKGGLRALN